MALIKINGVELKTPSDLTPSIMDLSKAERNANGTMIIERIATKRKLEVTWKALTGTEVSVLLQAVAPVFFYVEYLDPQENINKTGMFYCGDRKIPMLSFVNGVPKYKDIGFNLIER